jgi:hypothetical protein
MTFTLLNAGWVVLADIEYALKEFKRVMRCAMREGDPKLGRDAAE